MIKGYRKKFSLILEKYFFDIIALTIHYYGVF